MTPYGKYFYYWNSLTAIDRGTWGLIELCAKGYGVKACIEFGCGLSTKLMDDMGIEVTAFEDKPEYVNPVLEHLSQSAVILYDDIRELKVGSHYDMAFIDGPGSGMEREGAYFLAAKARIPLVICHDTWRCEESFLAKKYFGEWNVVGHVGNEICSTYTTALKLGDKNGGNTRKAEKSG